MIWVGIIPTDTEKALSLICSNIAVFDVSANLLYAFDIRMPIAGHVTVPSVTLPQM